MNPFHSQDYTTFFSDNVATILVMLKNTLVCFSNRRETGNLACGNPPVWFSYLDLDLDYLGLDIVL